MQSADKLQWTRKLNIISNKSGNKCKIGDWIRRCSLQARSFAASYERTGDAAAVVVVVVDRGLVD